MSFNTKSTFRLCMTVVCVALTTRGPAWSQETQEEPASDAHTSDAQSAAGVDSTVDPELPAEPKAPPSQSHRWHAPRKRARKLPRHVEPTEKDWNPLSGPVKSAKSLLKDVDITTDSDMAVDFQYADDVEMGKKSLGTFTWQNTGDWQLFSLDELGTSYVGWTALGALGFNYNTSSQTLSGNVGSISVVNNDVYPDPAVVDELFWKQVSTDEKFVLHGGKLDMSYDFDTNRVANDGYAQFMSFALENNLTIPFPEYGGFGGILRANFSKRLYVMLGMGDSSMDKAVLPWKTVDNDSWYQLLELGLTLDIAPLGTGHYRLTPWHNHLFDEDGWGIAVNFDQEVYFPWLLTFFRFGVGDGDVTPVKTNLSGGLGIEGPFGRSKDMIGLGASWADPSSSVGSDDETLLEAFYRIHLSPSIAWSPDVQLVFDPVDGTGGTVLVLGSRLSVAF